MHHSQKKEQFNIAYVTAIAAQAGVRHTTITVDDDSIDLMLIGRDYSGDIRNPQIQIQLKCTSQDMVQGDIIKFPLGVKNYNDLRGENVLCPRYLVILLVPDNHEEWIVHNDDCMMLHNRCFWVSIKAHPPTSNTSNVTVDVPIEQRFTMDSLLELMSAASYA